MLHTDKPPGDDEWSGFVDMLDKVSKSHDWDLARTGNLVFTDGGAPDTEQRTAVNVLVAQGKTLPPVALVTDSAVVRAMVRALSIFNSRLRVFSPSDLGGAMAHLGLLPHERAGLVARCVELERAELGAGAVKTLEAVRRAK